MLGSGTHGDAYIYDDTMLYEPEWRQVCEVIQHFAISAQDIFVCHGILIRLVFETECVAC